MNSKSTQFINFKTDSLVNLETAGYTREQTSLNMRRDLVFGSSRVSYYIMLFKNYWELGRSGLTVKVLVFHVGKLRLRLFEHCQTPPLRLPSFSPHRFCHPTLK